MQSIQRHSNTGRRFCPQCGREFSSEFQGSRCPDDGSLLTGAFVHDALVGQTLVCRYEVLSVIGTGGWGQVYRVRHTGLNKEMALKVLHGHLIDSPANVARFQREAEAASRLNHQSIAQVFDFGILDDGRPYMAMDFLNGDTLSTLIDRYGPMNWKHALPLFIEASEGLAYAHKKGVLHRDLKPSNLFVSCDNKQAWMDNQDDSEQLKILDFGLAKVFYGDEKHSESLTATGEALGTPAYMSPEQCKAEPLDRRSDIYSLGLVMYEVLTGSKPFNNAGLFDTMQAHISQPPPGFDTRAKDMQIPTGLEAIVMKCLAKSPDARFLSASELAEALRAVQSGNAWRINKLTQMQPRAQVMSPFRFVVAILLIACSAVGVLVYQRWSHSSQTAGQKTAAAVQSEDRAVVAAGNSDKAKVGAQTADSEKVRELQAQIKGLQEQLKYKEQLAKPGADHTAAQKPGGDEAELKRVREELRKLQSQMAGKQSSEESAGKAGMPATRTVAAAAIRPASTAEMQKPYPYGQPPKAVARVATGPAPVSQTARPTPAVQQISGDRYPSSYTVNHDARTSAYNRSPGISNSASPSSMPQSSGNGSGGNCKRFSKYWGQLPRDAQSLLNENDSAAVNAKRLEAWLRSTGSYNRRVEDELRGLFAEAGYARTSQSYVDDIFKHNVMDSWQLLHQSNEKLNSDPVGAIKSLLGNVQRSSGMKFLRAACIIKAGMLYAQIGKKTEAQRLIYMIATETDPELSSYVAYARNQLAQLR